MTFLEFCDMCEVYTEGKVPPPCETAEVLFCETRWLNVSNNASGGCCGGNCGVGCGCAGAPDATGFGGGYRGGRGGGGRHYPSRFPIGGEFRAPTAEDNFNFRAMFGVEVFDEPGLDDSIYRWVMNTHPHDMDGDQIQLIKMWKAAAEGKIDKEENAAKIRSLQSLAAAVVSTNERVMSHLMDEHEIQAPLRTLSSENPHLPPGPPNPTGVMREFQSVTLRDAGADNMVKYQNVIDYCNQLIKDHYETRWNEWQNYSTDVWADDSTDVWGVDSD